LTLSPWQELRGAGIKGMTDERRASLGHAGNGEHQPESDERTVCLEHLRNLLAGQTMDPGEVSQLKLANISELR
jgi:hypothetical protein